MAILLSKERNGSLSSATAAGQTSHHQRPVFPNRLFGAYTIALGAFSSCQLRVFRRFIAHLSPSSFPYLIVNLIAPPPSPMSPSLTQAPPAAPMLPMEKLIMHQHVLIALFRFDLPSLADTILRFSHCISTYSTHAPNPPRIIASATHLRGRCVGVESAVSPSPNTARCCLLNLCPRRMT